jgi:hypothetical protein
MLFLNRTWAPLLAGTTSEVRLPALATGLWFAYSFYLSVSQLESNILLFAKKRAFGLWIGKQEQLPQCNSLMALTSIASLLSYYLYASETVAATWYQNRQL